MSRVEVTTPSESTEWRVATKDILVGSVIRRARGVWLATTHHHRTGDMDYDAFPTLARAKRWVRDQFSAPLYRRIRWEYQRSGLIYLMADEWDEYYVEESD